MQEQKEQEQSPAGNLAICYLWISHGVNISASRNVYPYETNFKEIAFYSTPLSKIYMPELNALYTDPCTILSTEKKFIPIEDTDTGKKTVYLPPLIFGVVEYDFPEIKEHTGLFYLEIITDEHGVCHINTNVKLLDHTSIFEMGNITYSKISQVVTADCKVRRINPSNVVLSIFSCQDIDPRYGPEYGPQNIAELQGSNLTIIENIPQATILGNTVSDVEPNDYVSLTIIPTHVDLEREWTALAQVRHQGCGLNVLSFYDIIPQTSAREQAVCLSLQGTSIFKNIDYINNYLSKTSITTNNKGFSVVRANIIPGLESVLYFLGSFNPIYEYAVIFKLYKTDKHLGKDNHMGHTVSILKKPIFVDPISGISVPARIIYIDPQANIRLPLNIKQPLTIENLNELAELINNLYDKEHPFNFIDIIFTVRNIDSFAADRPKLKFTDFIVSNTVVSGRILDKTLKYYGGKKIRQRKIKSKHNKSKHNKSKNNKSKHNKSKNNKSKNNKSKHNKTKNNKSKHNKTFKRIQNGGMLDDFEKLSLEIDKKNNTESLIVIIE
jgi:hypothetical protein